MYPNSAGRVEQTLAAAFRAAVGETAWLSDFDAPPTQRDWGRLITVAINERVLGPLLAASEAGLPLTERQNDELRLRHSEAMEVACALEASLGSVLGDLRKLGVQPIVLKGMATSHVGWRDPSLRQFGDIDLLVSAEGLGSIVERTRSTGGRFQTAPIGPATQFVQKGVTTLLDTGHEIDIHQAISWGPKWLALSEVLFEQTQEVELSHVRFTALEETAMLFHAAVSVQQPRPRLSSLFDLALFLKSEAYDEARLRELTEASSSGFIVYSSCTMAREWWPELRIPTLRKSQRAASPTWPVRDRIQMAIMGRLYVSILASLGDVPWRLRPQVVRELLVPTGEWRSTSERTRSEHILTMSRKLLSRSQD